MDTFKSWLVANLEILLIIATVLILLIGAPFAIRNHETDPEMIGVGVYFIIVIAVSFLCFIIVSLIKSGLGTFLIMTLFIGGMVLIAVWGNRLEKENQTENVQEFSLDEPESFKISDALTNAFGEEGYKKFKTIFFSSLIATIVLAIATGTIASIYAYKNFDEVVSRRFLYRNSDVSVFEVQWKYAFNRFYAGFMAVACVMVEIGIMVFFLVLLSDA